MKTWVNLPVIVRDPFSPQPELILSRGQGEGVNLTVWEIPFFKQVLKKCKVILFESLNGIWEKNILMLKVTRLSDNST
jgi:hypothetical protein